MLLYKYVWGTAVHWYTGNDFPNLNTTHYLYPNKPILATEATEVREKTQRAQCEHYAHDIMGDIFMIHDLWETNIIIIASKASL